jgi:hypothetical protein
MKGDDVVANIEHPAQLWVCNNCGDFAEDEPGHTCEVCCEGMIEAVEYVRADAYRGAVEALERIRDHGQTHDEPCYAITNGDCADVMQEIARATLAPRGGQ